MGFNEVDSVEGYDAAAVSLTESWVQKLTNVSLPSTSATRSNEITNEGNVPDDESEYAECVSTHPGSDAVGAGGNNPGPSASAGVPNGDGGLGDGSSTVLSFIPVSGLLPSVEDSSSQSGSHDDDGSDEFHDCQEEENSAEGQATSGPRSSDDSSEESLPGESGGEAEHSKDNSKASSRDNDGTDGELDDNRSEKFYGREEDGRCGASAGDEGSSVWDSIVPSGYESSMVDLDEEFDRKLAEIVREEDDWIEVAGAVNRLFSDPTLPQVFDPFSAVLSHVRETRRPSISLSRAHGASAYESDPIANEAALWDPLYDDAVFLSIISLVKFRSLNPFLILLDRSFVVTLTTDAAEVQSFRLLQTIFLVIVEIGRPHPGREIKELEALCSALDLWVPRIVEAIRNQGFTSGLQEHLEVIGGLLRLDSDDRDGLSRVYDRVIEMFKSLARVAIEAGGVEDVKSLTRVLDSIVTQKGFDLDRSDDIGRLLSSPPSSPAVTGLRKGTDDSGYLSNTELSPGAKKRKRDAEEDREGEEGTSRVKRTRIEGYATEATEATETVGKGKRRREEDDQEGAGVGTKRPRMM